MSRGQPCPTIVAKCCQLSSTEVDAGCDKLSAVGDRTKLTVFVLFDDLGGFITLSDGTLRAMQRVARVHLRLTADTCFQPSQQCRRRCCC